MKSIIVADTSPLIALAKLQQLTLLNSEFSNVHVPLTVLSEATRDMQRPDARLIRDFASKHLIVHEDADNAVSYTHLDVYKRQILLYPIF